MNVNPEELITMLFFFLSRSKQLKQVNVITPGEAASRQNNRKYHRRR